MEDIYPAVHDSIHFIFSYIGSSKLLHQREKLFVKGMQVVDDRYGTGTYE